MLHQIALYIFYQTICLTYPYFFEKGIMRKTQNFSTIWPFSILLLYNKLFNTSYWPQFLVKAKKKTKQKQCDINVDKS